MQPTSEGVNSRTVCQPRVMMLLWPAQREDTSTMGPGSRYRRTWLTGKSLFSGCFGIGVLSRAPLCSDALGCSNSVRARASKYNLCSRTDDDVLSRSFQDGQHGHGVAEKLEP